MLFLDVETTGLDPKRDVILEVAAISVDDDLVKTGELSVVVDHDVLPEISTTVQLMHDKSGLWNDVANAKHWMGAVDQMVYEFALAKQGARNVLLANFNAPFDRSFVREHLTRLESVLHYRVFDVSTLKEAVWKWHRLETVKKEPRHRALSDAHDALEFCRWYRHISCDGPRRVQRLLKDINLDDLRAADQTEVARLIEEAQR